MPALRTARVSIFSPSGLVFLFGRSLHRYFITGRSVTGRPTDNASFLHAATKDERGKPVERLSAPIWQRLARRWAALGVPLVMLTLAGLSVPVRFVCELFGAETPGFFLLPWVRVAVVWEALAVIAVASIAAQVGLSYWSQRKRISEFVYPTWQAACVAMSSTYRKREARKMIELPEGFAVDDASVETMLSRFIDRVWRKARDQRRLEEAERAAEAAVDDELPEEPGTEIEVRPKRPVARYFGRKVIPETVEQPETPPVRVRLLPGRVVTDAQKRAFVMSVGAVLGMPDARANWYGRGKSPFVELRPNLAPPAAVNFDMIRKHLAKTTITTPLMGLAAGNRPIKIDLDNNSPHTMISGGSGTGKSLLLRSLLAQRMHSGVGVVMFDYKRVSHRWLHNMPGCEYVWRLSEIHDRLCAAGEELGRRLETVLPPGNDLDAKMKVFPTLDIVVEEINSTTKLLEAYWRSVLGGKGISPAVTALMTLVNMGREYCMHVWIAAQRASASVFGSNGGDLRESFQTRLLAKWSIQTWKMLAGNAQYRRPIGGRGVWARVQDDEVEIVRVPFWTTTEARAHAMAGIECPAVVLPDSGQYLSPMPTEHAVEDIGPRLVTLSASLPHLPADNAGRRLSISGLRTASRRPGFPVPLVIGEATRPSLYDLDALIEWRARGVGEVGALTELFEQPAKPTELRRRGIIYQFDTLNLQTGAVEVGYIGQTRRTLAEREAEHRGDKPWGDLIVGSGRIIWEGEPTDDELDAIERQFIGKLRPRYNIEHQIGAAHAVPKWTQLEQRHARDAARGDEPWVPIDVYNGERHPERVQEWRRDD